MIMDKNENSCAPAETSEVAGEFTDADDTMGAQGRTVIPALFDNVTDNLTEEYSATGSAENPELKFHAEGRDYSYRNTEVALISACFNRPKVLIRVCATLSTEDIYDDDNNILMRAILDLYNQGVRPAPANVLAYLKGTVPDFGNEWIAHVNRCAAASFNPKHIAWYIKQLKKATAIRGGDTYCEHHFSESFCANLLKTRLADCKCVGKNWYEYVEGAWTLTDKSIYRKLAHEVIHPHQRQEKRAMGVLDHVESAYQVSERIFCGSYKREGENILINCANRTLVVDPTGAVAFRQHDKADYFTLKLAAGYDPKARCPLFDRVLSECLPDADDRLLLQVFGGYALYPGCEYEASLVSHGEGQTGKSTLAGTLGHVLGKELCSSCGLEELCEPGSYSLPMLKNRMLNLGAELEGNEIATSANFKKLVSGEFLNARQIYCKPEEMSTNCKLLFLTNHMPRFRAGTYAEERRLRILRFGQQVAAEDTTLKERLRGEASGVLNWMLEGLAWLLRNKYVPYGGAQSLELTEEFHKSNDPVSAYVKERCTLDPKKALSKTDLFDDFKSWCEASGLPGEKMQNVFFKRLIQLYDLKTAREKWGDKRVYCYRGITFRD